MQETPRPQSELYRSVMGDIAGRVMETEANLPAGLAQAMPSSPADREPTQASASASRLARRLISLEHPPIVLQRILRGDEVADDNYRPKRSVA